MVQSSFYSEEELMSMGFKSIGKGCMISRKASFYDVGRISIGNNVRIDDFCILSGLITLGNNIHISAYVALYGAEGIELEDYTGISAHSTIYSAMDDFSGDYLIGPIHPEEYTNVTGGKVTIKTYTQIGANVLVFPNLTIGEGCAVGACSMVRKDLEPWGVYYGLPATRQKERRQGLLKYINMSSTNLL
jgi:galactoside O-acetyltransferase